MNIKKNPLLWLVIINLFFISSLNAKNMETQGDIDIHYIALNSTFLTPEIAKTYQLQRSRYQALVNIAVLDNSKIGKPAKSVKIIGTATNLAGQRKKLSFTEVKEGESIYYLAQVRFSNEETLKFELTITDQGKQHTLIFSQKLYLD